MRTIEAFLSEFTVNLSVERRKVVKRRLQSEANNLGLRAFHQDEQFYFYQ